MKNELAHRQSQGLEVWLHWNSDDDSVTLRVADSRTGEEFERDVPREQALEAFRHPFLFAPELAAAA
jgi:hypothetical protein